MDSFSTEGMKLVLALFGAVSLPQAPTAWETNGAGKQHLVYRQYAELNGSNYLTRNQSSASNCVGQSVATAIDIRQVLVGKPLPAKIDASFIYGVSRVDNAVKFRHGAIPLHAVRSSEDVGNVLMLNYWMLGYDLTEESPDRSEVWGARGPPPELRGIASQYRISEAYQVKNYQQLRGALANGYPVIVGSNVGYGRGDIVRDSKGYLYSSRSIFGGWAHCMTIVAVDDTRDRGVLVLNSWGTRWVRGPQRFGDEPLGSFWITVNDANKMLKQGGSFAIGSLR
jgi:hypothetical protein